MLSGGQFCSLLAEPVAHLQALEGCEVGSVARHEHQFLGVRNGGNLAIGKGWALPPGLQLRPWGAMPQGGAAVLGEHGEAAG